MIKFIRQKLPYTQETCQLQNGIHNAIILITHFYKFELPTVVPVFVNKDWCVDS